jgi:spore coat polysaccharide biosynthesis protein SpsF
MILAILQARVSSTRLPGKVLLPLLGAPMILRQVERVRRARRIDRLVVATSTEPSDDPLVAMLEAEGLEVARGPLDDVLKRFVLAARPHAPDWVVRLTADCPLADPTLIDRVVDETQASGADYGSNALKPTFPNGLEAEVVRFRLLEALDSGARTDAEREHVTFAIYREPGRYRLHSVESAQPLEQHRWTVDEPRDFALVERVYEALYPKDAAFTTADILGFLDAHPEVAALNAGIARNAGLRRSLLNERAAHG